MADSTADAGTNDATENTVAEKTVDHANGFMPITSQEELDRIVGARLAREKQRYQGFEDYKAKASKYDAVLVELEETRGKLAVLENEQNQAQWRAQVAEETGVPASVLRGSTLEELQEHAKNLAEYLPKNSGMPLVPTAGREPAEGNAPVETQFVRSLFGNN